MESAGKDEAPILEVNFNGLKIPEQVLTEDSVNSLAEALRNIGEIVHGKEIVVAPQGFAYLEGSLDRNGTSHIAGALAGGYLGGRWESVGVGKSGTQNGSTRTGVQNEGSGLTIHLDFEQDQTESTVELKRNSGRASSKWRRIRSLCGRREDRGQKESGARDLPKRGHTAASRSSRRQ
jgi:hypothetical protein